VLVKLNLLPLNLSLLVNINDGNHHPSRNF
jgi:hypothetical protein